MLCRIPWHVKSEPVTHFCDLIKNNYRNLMNTVLVQNIVLTREDGTLVRAEKKPSWPKDQKVKHISPLFLVSCGNYKQKDL